MIIEKLGKSDYETLKSLPCEVVKLKLVQVKDTAGIQNFLSSYKFGKTSEIKGKVNKQR